MLFELESSFDALRTETLDWTLLYNALQTFMHLLCRVSLQNGLGNGFLNSLSRGDLLMPPSSSQFLICLKRNRYALINNYAICLYLLEDKYFAKINITYFFLIYEFIYNIFTIFIFSRKGCSNEFS